jgi:hypothetical protein
MTPDGYASTREVARLLDRRDFAWLRERLRLMGIPSRRLGRFGRIYWHVASVMSAFGERSTENIRREPGRSVG